MDEAIKTLEAMVAAGLASERAPTPERVREYVGMLRLLPMFEPIDDIVAERVARQFEERLGVTMSIGAQLTTPEFEPWLEQARSGIDPYYWERYRRLLVQKGFAPQVLATMDQVTDRIVGLLENPAKTGEWKRRGMVVGHVQSGKTANYTAVACKAADAGYRLIVVIAGVHNNLRNQTQMRIDEGFIGRASAISMRPSATEGIIGVGQFDMRRRPASFTNSVKDFTKVMASGVGVPLDDLKEPAILVIKKNSNTLKNVIEWLKEHNAKRGTKTISAPMLLIDDEADNASINTAKGKGEVTRINGQLRELLGTFERSCYVGYTATPFANIFIDPDTEDQMLGEDLFPRDFIISLDPPNNYFGANRIFVERRPDIIREIDDNEDVLPLKHRIDHEVAELPESLLRAVRAFVIGRALRLLRGQVDQHCSMLVNASRFTRVQGQIRNEIHAILNTIRSSIRVNGALPPRDALSDPEIRALHHVWQQEFSEAGSGWPAVQQKLHEAASPIIVVEVNSRSSGSLNYADHAKTGLSVIAVGGFSLSRGLTLEGLTVSYFLRNSMMYDTLMQMGRWFGYRAGYEDLCRIWMLEEAEGWYTHIADAIEELRAELRVMEAAHATPREFGLKVRSHPDTLIVTARNKMGSGKSVVKRIGLANSFIETALLKCDPQSLRDNRTAAGRLAGDLSAGAARGVDCGKGWLFDRVPAAHVLDFIQAFQNHVGSMLTMGDPVAQYIRERSSGELSEWQVYFPSIESSANPTDNTDILGWKVVCQRRTAGKRSDSDTLFVGNKQRVASRGIERIGLDEAKARKAEEDYRAEQSTPPGQEPNYPDRIYREIRERPLLIVHLLEMGLDQPVVAWSISFPKTSTPERTVEYVVNTTWMRENMGADAEDDELGGDEE
jgi:hypothetical protein